MLKAAPQPVSASTSSGRSLRRGDAPDVLADVVQAGDAEVRQAERGVGHAGAGEVDRLEPGALGEQRAVGVDGADDLQRSLVGEGGAKPGACGGQSGHGQTPFAVQQRALESIAQRDCLRTPPPLVGASAGAGPSMPALCAAPVDRWSPAALSSGVARPARVDVDLRLLRRLVRRVDAGEVLELAARGPCA